MKDRSWGWVVVAGMGLLAQAVCAQQADRQEWLVAGSGTNTLLTKVLVEAFTDRHPDIRIRVGSSIGSTGGIKAVHAGKIALALTSRPLRTEEQSWNLKSLSYARTAVVFGVNSSVPDGAVSTQDVLDIFAGRRDKWSNGDTIVVVMREEGDSGAELLMNAIPDIRSLFEKAWRAGTWRIEYRDAECNRTLERLKGAIGWSDLGSIRLGGHSIKPLKFDGRLPSAESVASGRYPLYKDLSFVYSEERMPASLRAFVEFVRSGEGEALIRKSGYVPLK